VGGIWAVTGRPSPPGALPPARSRPALPQPFCPGCGRYRRRQHRGCLQPTSEAGEKDPLTSYQASECCVSPADGCCEVTSGRSWQGSRHGQRPLSPRLARRVPGLAVRLLRSSVSGPSPVPPASSDAGRRLGWKVLAVLRNRWTVAAVRRVSELCYRWFCLWFPFSGEKGEVVLSLGVLPRPFVCDLFPWAPGIVFC